MVPRRVLRTIGCGLAATLLAVLTITAARWAALSWVGRAGTEPLGPWREGMTLRQTYGGFPAIGRDRDGAPRLRLLDENVEAWVERWRMVSGAREQVDVTSFIVHNDIYGRSFFGLLLNRADAGVKVRLLVDGLGTDLDRSLTDEDYLDELVAAGIQTRVYRPLAVRVTQAIANLDPLGAIASEHDKLILVDRRQSIIGGRNLGAEYFQAHDQAPRAFHDVDVAIEDEAVTRALEGPFLASWNNDASEVVEGELVNAVSSREELLAAYRAMDLHLRGQEPPADAPAMVEVLAELRRDHPELAGALARMERSPPRSVTGEVRLLDSGPRQDDWNDQLSEGLRRLLSSAEREVVIETPYLVLSKDDVKVFTRAAARGVKITIVTNSPASSDNALSQAFFLEQWPEVMARVPTLRLFARGDGHNLHGKTAVYDGQVSVVSTYNMDPVSMRIQGEVAVVVWSAPFARKAAEPALGMIRDGAPTTFEYRIQRGPDGQAVRGEDGRPIVLFGPEQHSSPERWTSLNAMWKTIRALRGVGFEPVF